MTFIHTFEPVAIAFQLGSITIYWYGIIMALAIATALLFATHTAKFFQIAKETILDLSIWLIAGGLIGARVYEIFLNFPYYQNNPKEVIQIWHGGLAIHGALIGGFIALLLFDKRKKINPLNMIAILTPAIALGQAIGRWGNWFNQELFGLPTGLPWGIPINFLNRPEGYKAFTYFHPTFLYESIANLILAIILYICIRQKKSAGIIVGIYMVGYGIIRFALEFIKIDPTPEMVGLRLPQLVSIILILIGFGVIFGQDTKKQLI
ncbi:MAG TPA: prolipoprotein diacylglyceryl transferase [bacterium]|nr:prolipoprotein diacylglyceryl transferase [bacterium]